MEHKKNILQTNTICSIVIYAPTFKSLKMDETLRTKLNELLTKIALLTAACEGNLHHEHTMINEAIFYKAVEIQTDLIAITEN